MPLILLLKRAGVSSKGRYNGRSGFTSNSRLRKRKDKSNGVSRLVQSPEKRCKATLKTCVQESHFSGLDEIIDFSDSADVKAQLTALNKMQTGRWKVSKEQCDNAAAYIAYRFANESVSRDGDGDNREICHYSWNDDPCGFRQLLDQGGYNTLMNVIRYGYGVNDDGSIHVDVCEERQFPGLGDPTYLDGDGTHWHFCLDHYDEDTAGILYGYTIDLRSTNIFGDTVIHDVLSRCDALDDVSDFVRAAFVCDDALVNMRGFANQTPMHVAAMLYNDTYTTLTSFESADFRAIDAYGCSPRGLRMRKVLLNTTSHDELCLALQGHLNGTDHTERSNKLNECFDLALELGLDTPLFYRSPRAAWKILADLAIERRDGAVFGKLLMYKGQAFIDYLKNEYPDDNEVPNTINRYFESTPDSTIDVHYRVQLASLFKCEEPLKGVDADEIKPAVYAYLTEGRFSREKLNAFLFLRRFSTDLVNVTDGQGTHLIHWLAKEGCRSRESFSYTALTHLTDMVSPNLADQDGNTVMHFFVENEISSCFFDFYQRYGGCWNRKNNAEKTPADVCEEKGFLHPGRHILIQTISYDEDQYPDWLNLPWKLGDPIYKDSLPREFIKQKK